ncbi:MAG: C4-dicarboxylate transporter DcuC, partial [Salibacteraceae bacterium]|nr:C4-dicarboxylate transporter DcuC [Salibacteraceae bacterium]
VIPIGQILFVCIPSAAGLSLLLMAAVFPILINLGVSRIAAVSVITSCTAFGIGPASAITASATLISGEDPIIYFISHQLPLVIPSSLVMMIAYFFVNRYFDKKDAEAEKNLDEVAINESDKPSTTAPLFYAILPVVPLILLIVFSEILNLTPTPIHLDTSTAMIISLFVAVLVEFARKRDLKAMFSSLQVFWNGMGNIFKTVVTLIIAAEVFSKGLIALGFIEGLVQITENLGFGAVGIGIVLTLIIFLSSMLMGSGNAAFFAFGPLVPKIATKLGIKSTEIILPMNLSASMGRTVSPVAGIIIACSEIAGVSALSIVKRNIIPLSAGFLTLLLTHYL